MKNLILILMLCAMITSCVSEKAEWSVLSPSENIKFTVFFSEKNSLLYDVSIIDEGSDKKIIANSQLGIRRSDASFIEKLSFVSEISGVTISESFSIPLGKKKSISTEMNELTLTFRNDAGNLVELIIRVSNDGAAFRYRFPETDNGIFSVEEELTGFAIEGDGKKWIAPYDKVTVYSPAYERYFKNGIPIGTKAPGEEGWCLPALFQTESAWLLLSEAALDSTYFGFHLQPNAEGGKYSIRMPEENEAKNVCSSIPNSTLPWATPWRVLIIGKNLSDIVESNLIVALNPPSKIEDASWIKPGRASWSWWGDWPSSKNFESLKNFIDLAAEMGWEYSLVDANWDIMTGGNIEELVKYANSKNVGVLMWYNSGGPHNDVTERPRDIMSNDALRKEEFEKLAGWGVRGIKVDFFQSDKPQIIKQYLDILKDAADNKLLVNFHGCTMPRGWERTWPNLVSMEAVRGAESYGYDSTYTDNAVWHNTILPFTRNAIGSMDYTPVTFSNHNFAHKTTFGHELALSVVFESGILHFADRCESYRSLPEAPKNFIKTVPVTWDETLLLEGFPGKHCVIARKSGDTWFIGGINGESEKQTWDIDLSRLKGNDFSVSVISDGTTDKEFLTNEISLKKGDKLKVEVLPFGGFVATLK